MRQDRLHVANNRNVSRHVLRDLGRIDVDVDELGVRSELVELAGDAIVEAGADRADQVSLIHRVVRCSRSVHAEHPEPLIAFGRERPEPHQSARDRKAVACGQCAQLLGGIAEDDAAADIKHRPLCRR